MQQYPAKWNVQPMVIPQRGAMRWLGFYAGYRMSKNKACALAGGQAMLSGRKHAIHPEIWGGGFQNETV